ncbi:efflux transporter outer membrane subunit, partial [bacterium]|nr:efflux transporter outer membrane subunit [bacterium]
PGEDLFRTPATKDVSAGLPSEVLERRPDIMQAERTLRAADANIGVARAAFFPRIALTANAGVASADLSNLFKGGTGAWTFAPQATLPIFGAGRLKGNLAAAKAERGIALAQYERAIQGAFREVADALALRGTVDERIAAQEALVAATGASQRISEQRFRTGISSYLDVLDAQRTLYDAQKALISVRLAKADNNVTLYKVLGGGWTANTPAPKDAAPVGGAAEKRSDAAAMQAASPR